MRGIDNLDESFFQHSSELENYTDLEKLCATVIPVWCGQIESAKKLGDESILELSQKFYGLSEKIRISTSTSLDKNSSSDLVSLLHESQTQLSVVLSLLKSSMQEKEQLIQSILDLTLQANALKGMAEAVGKSAREINMVAINAAIEAAHVGDAGKGFAVVANAVKLLSTSVASTGKQISEKINFVIEAINITKNISQEFESRDSEVLSNAEKIVDDVLSNFKITSEMLTEKEKKISNEATRTRNEISDVLVYLQFQDRVSQKISHIQADLAKLRNAILRQDEMFSSNKWLNELESTYTMKEENEVHIAVSKIY